MEFNIEADRASARLRRGVQSHTLSVGDRDATAMINGGITDLQRLALAVAAEAGLKIRIDGHIDGNALARQYSDDLKEALHQCQRLSNEQQRRDMETRQLVEQIQAKASQLNGEQPQVGPELRYFAGHELSGTHPEWSARIPVKKRGRRDRYLSAYGDTADAAIRALADKVGAL
jgi:hypothetical protein